MRLTINVAPATTNLLNKSGIPFGAVIHPLADDVSIVFFKENN
jgi:hypothetical protein